MPGKIKRMIDTIIQQRAKGNVTLENVIKTKLILKGINPSAFTDKSSDDEVVIAKLKTMLKN